MQSELCHFQGCLELTWMSHQRLKGARKSWWIIIFVFDTKISKNAFNILNCYYWNQIYTLTHQTKYLQVGNLLLVNSTYLIVSALLKQRRLIQTKEHFKFYYSVRIETTHKPSKLAAVKNFFSSVYVVDATCFDECFLY